MQSWLVESQTWFGTGVGPPPLPPSPPPPPAAANTTITMTEFGRTAADNGSGGTDHGHASAWFVAGAVG